MHGTNEHAGVYWCLSQQSLCLHSLRTIVIAKIKSRGVPCTVKEENKEGKRSKTQREGKKGEGNNKEWNKNIYF